MPNRRIPVSKQCALIGDGIDVRCFITHHSLVVGTDVPVADIITPYNQYVWFYSAALAGAHTRYSTVNSAIAVANVLLEWVIFMKLF